MCRSTFPLALAVLLAACLLSGCLEGDKPASAAAAAPQIATVDLERIMTRSSAAEAGRAHLAQARQRLEQGFADLQKAWAKAPAKEREAVLRDGALALSRQMAAEEAAVQNVINKLLLEEVKAWRQAHKAALVLARQNALDADDTLDITSSVLTGMDARKPAFPALPVVSVKLPPNAEQKAAEQKAAPTGKTPAAPRAPDRKKR
ncbi:OmpH family outer membrane protein [Desulfovibrio sp. ZJ200]|uniref:OmpH family outer membrane protein n=1 Tax=Desulfovibrio sp. ZJ200 TaxID=2709792 RepID=UPI001F1546C0|nr:OmpH family outer membrane protein [Desulfovibrio sp. ZJ200]